MRLRRLLILPLAALSAASCSQPEPTVVSEAPGRTAATSRVDASSGNEAPAGSGRFIARCATEAEGNGVPGATIFTDGSEGVTDHCLSRYYIGLQPAPGAVYVPDDEAGSSAPTRWNESSRTTTPTWTPAQPRTDGTSDADGRYPGDGQQNGEGATPTPNPGTVDRDPQAGEPAEGTPTTGTRPGVTVPPGVSTPPLPGIDLLPGQGGTGQGTTGTGTEPGTTPGTGTGGSQTGTAPSPTPTEDPQTTGGGSGSQSTGSGPSSSGHLPGWPGGSTLATPITGSALPTAVPTLPAPSVTSGAPAGS